jgi:hypothetical protein
MTDDTDDNLRGVSADGKLVTLRSKYTSSTHYIVHINADSAGVLVDPATSELQAAANGTLSNILAKLSNVPATETSLAGVVANTNLLGTKTDAKSTLTDATSVSAMSVWKQISASVQSLVTGTALAAGAALIGRAVADASAATGGIASTTRLLSSAATTNATSAKVSAGRLYAAHGYNAATGVRYLKLYNKASSPAVGTDTPVKTIALPPSCGFAFDWPVGYSFATGIAFAITAASSDADTTAVAAGDILGLNLDYV